jgi:hypothetical protein
VETYWRQLSHSWPSSTNVSQHVCAGQDTSPYRRQRQPSSCGAFPAYRPAHPLYPSTHENRFGRGALCPQLQLAVKFRARRRARLLRIRPWLSGLPIAAAFDKAGKRPTDVPARVRVFDQLTAAARQLAGRRHRAGCLQSLLRDVAVVRPTDSGAYRHGASRLSGPLIAATEATRPRPRRQRHPRRDQRQGCRRHRADRCDEQEQGPCEGGRGAGAKAPTLAQTTPLVRRAGTLVELADEMVQGR